MNIEDARIVVAEDEPLLLEYFAKWLKRLGCKNVSTAADGREALQRLREAPADLLISDVRMPEIDGVSLVRHLSADRIDVPSIIFISGFGDIDRREMYALGVEAFLSKPVTMHDLADQVRTSLQNRASLWHTPFAQEPKQRLEALEAALHGVLAELPHTRIRLGRGGFSVSPVPAMTLGRVAFDLRFPGDQTSFSGHGFVRWYSKADQAAGVEISYIEEGGRAWLLEKQQSAEHSNGYIPG